MLRVSAQSTGNTELNLLAVTAQSRDAPGIPGGEALVAFAESAVENASNLPAARQRVKSELGEQALIEAAAVVGNFERMTRIADGAGIPLDARNLDFSKPVRAMLALDKFASARLPETLDRHRLRSTFQ